MKMKIKDYSKRIFAVLFICILMLNVFATSVFADTEHGGGGASFGDTEQGGGGASFGDTSTPPFVDFTSGGGTNHKLDSSELTYDTVDALFNYYDLLFACNMTNGYRLAAIYFNQSYGWTINLVFVSGSNWGNNPDADSVYLRYYNVVNPSGSTPTFYFEIIGGDGSVASVRTMSGQPTEVGNLNSITWNSLTQISFSCYAYAYRSADNEIICASRKGDNFFTEGTAAPWIVERIDRLYAYISTLGTPGDTEIVISNSIDIGSIITAMMTSYMSIFNGFFGFTIFGINIASTLISILVIGIVIFIVKIISGK